MTCELQIETPEHRIRRVTLEGAGLSLGRAHDNDLSFPEDASLSRTHLRIERDGDGWAVNDLQSKNGTLLNGTRVTGPQRLHPGDRLLAGSLVIRYVDPERSQPGSVVFVPGAEPGLSSQATVMTSLEGLLSSGEPTTERVVARPPPGVRQPLHVFEQPVVRALIRAGRELQGNQPLADLFRLILELSIEAVGAERGVLMILEGDALVSQAEHGDGFRISTTVRDRVLEGKNSLLVRNTQNEQALREQLSISEQQIHSLMAVPLQTDDRVIGLIYVDSRLFVREFTPDDLNLLTVLANVAAIRIDHQRHLELQQQEQRRTRDLEQAAEIQGSILPAGPPAIPGLDLVGHNAACRTVGGDYFDFLPYPDGRCAVVVADVAGKGMSAALLMSSLQARVQLLMEEHDDLAVMMSRLNRSIASRCPHNRFVTMFLCVIDPRAGLMTYCNAGHNPALLVRATGEVRELKAVGTVLGILPEAEYREEQDRLELGDLVALYSDGVTEALSPEGEEFGQDRLAQLLVLHRQERAERIVQAVIEALAVWSAAAPPEDDVTLVVGRRDR